MYERTFAGSSLHGKLGGRKRTAFEMEGILPTRFVRKEINPSRFARAFGVVKFKIFVEEKFAELGIKKEDITSEKFGLLQKYFPGQRSRRLRQWYDDKGGKARMVKELELGSHGGRKNEVGIP